MPHMRKSGELVSIPKGTHPLISKATGRGSCQMCRVNKYSFPRTSAKKSKVVKGFITGDLVKAIVSTGKKVGTYVGRVAVRSAGSFDSKTTNGGVQGISWKYCQRLQKVDGYLYN